MVDMICMANSWRPPQGRCIAGIDLNTGKWIRPVPADGGSIPERRARANGRKLALLDIIRLDLEPPELDTKYQKENRCIRSWGWEFVRTADVDEVKKYVRNRRVLHGTSKVVDPDDLAILPPEKWVSLQLVQSDNVLFERNLKKRNRWNAVFSTRALGPRYELSVTDPVATDRLNKGDQIGGNCLLTVSLTEPIALPQYHLPTLCYKLVAGVIEL